VIDSEPAQTTPSPPPTGRGANGGKKAQYGSELPYM